MENNSNNMAGDSEGINNNNIIITTSSSTSNEDSSNKGGLVLPPLNNNSNNILYVASTANNNNNNNNNNSNNNTHTALNSNSTTTTTTITNNSNNIIIDRSSPVTNDPNKGTDQNDSQFSDMDVENNDFLKNVESGNGLSTIETTVSSSTNNKKNIVTTTNTVRRFNLPNNDFVTDEIVVDGLREWVPIHLLRKTKAKFWTHYLGLDKHLSVVKCKHCGELLEKFTSSSSSSNSNDSLQTTKKLQKHLKKNHHLDPLVSYYADKQILFDPTINPSNYKTSSDFITHYHYSNNTRTGPMNINSADSNGSSSTVPVSLTAPIDPMAQQIQNSSPLSKLIAIIVASQNLSINFINDPAMKLLYSKLSKPYYPNQSSIKSTIKQISRQINSIVKRTANRNDLDLQLIVDTDNLPTDISERSMLFTNRLHLFLDEINKITLFSLTSTVWDNKLNKEKYPINVLSLQYYDSYRNSLKTIPLNVKLSESNLINTVTVRNQLLDAYHSIPNLYKSTLSLTLPQTKPTNINNLEISGLPPNRDIPTHICIVSILSEIVKPIFTDDTLVNLILSSTDQNVKINSASADITGQSILDPQNTMTPPIINDDVYGNGADCFKPKNYYSNDTDQHLLDACVDLSKVDLSNNTQSIFTRIKKFYNELNANPWQLERFNQMYRETFNETNGPVLQTFDKYFYSTAQSTLQTFIDLKPIVLNIQSSLQCENFKEVDFAIISTLLDFIKSINKLIIFFGTTKRLNFVYIIFTILSIERQLDKIIDDCNVKSLVKTFKKIRSIVKRHKKSLLDDKMNLLALFCCPAILFDRDALEYIFKTVSLSEIVNKVSKIVRDIIKRFITIEFVSNNNNNNININNGGSGEGNDISNTDPALLNDIHANCRYFSGNENKIIETEIDSILDHIINEDLYEYLSTVNTIVPLSYKAYCEQTGYISDEGHFKKIIDDSHAIEDVTEVDQLLDIHVPVCTAFWDQYLTNGAGRIVRLLLKIMITQSSTSKRIEYEFLNDFIPKLGDEYLEDVVKIRLFNEQFSAGKVDYEVDTLATIAQYD